MANVGLWYSLRYISRAATPDVCFTPEQIQSAWVSDDPGNPDISTGTGHCYYVFKSQTRSGKTIDYPQYTVFEKYQAGTTYTAGSKPHQGVVCGSCVDPSQCPGMNLPYTALDSIHFNPLAGQLNYLAGKEVGYTLPSCGIIVSPTPMLTPTPTITQTPTPTGTTCTNNTCLDFDTTPNGTVDISDVQKLANRIGSTVNYAVRYDVRCPKVSPIDISDVQYMANRIGMATCTAP